MARPRKDIRLFPELDPSLVEAKLLEFIEAAEVQAGLSGSDKKAYAKKRFGKWLDDVIRLPWYLEPFDGLAINLALNVVDWLIGGWMESVFTRWKAAKAATVVVEEDKGKKKK